VVAVVTLLAGAQLDSSTYEERAWISIERAATVVVV
jgi:hypothetical protein